MARVSAGLLMHRYLNGRREVFLVHPGGPFWARKDRQAWSIPKGECDVGEDALAAARREFAEETVVHPDGPLYVANTEENSISVTKSCPFTIAPLRSVTESAGQRVGRCVTSAGFEEPDVPVT